MKTLRGISMLSLTVVCCIVSLFADPVPRIAAMDPCRLLNAAIDSLELEKQARSRVGLPLDELDAATARYRDSVMIARQQMENTAAQQPVVQAASADRNGRHLALPKLPDFFNGMLTIAGAVVTGAAFLFVLFLLIESAKRRRQAAAGKPVAQQPARQARVIAEKMSPMAPMPPRGEIRRMASAADESDSHEAAVQAAAFKPVRNAGTVKRDDLCELVMAAEGDGLSDREISRLYHISVDHVALTRKMARQRR